MKPKDIIQNLNEIWTSLDQLERYKNIGPEMGPSGGHGGGGAPSRGSITPVGPGTASYKGSTVPTFKGQPVPVTPQAIKPATQTTTQPVPQTTLGKTDPKLGQPTTQTTQTTLGKTDPTLDPNALAAQSGRKAQPSWMKDKSDKSTVVKQEPTVDTKALATQPGRVKQPSWMKDKPSLATQAKTLAKNAVNKLKPGDTSVKTKDFTPTSDKDYMPRSAAMSTGLHGAALLAWMAANKDKVSPETLAQVTNNQPLSINLELPKNAGASSTTPTTTTPSSGSTSAAPAASAAQADDLEQIKKNAGIAKPSEKPSEPTSATTKDTSVATPSADKKPAAATPLQPKADTTDKDIPTQWTSDLENHRGVNTNVVNVPSPLRTQPSVTKPSGKTATEPSYGDVLDRQQTKAITPAPKAAAQEPNVELPKLDNRAPVRAATTSPEIPTTKSTNVSTAPAGDSTGTTKNVGGTTEPTGSDKLGTSNVSGKDVIAFNPRPNAGNVPSYSRERDAGTSTAGTSTAGTSTTGTSTTGTATAGTDNRNVDVTGGQRSTAGTTTATTPSTSSSTAQKSATTTGGDSDVASRVLNKGSGFTTPPAAQDRSKTCRVREDDETVSNTNRLNSIIKLAGLNSTKEITESNMSLDFKRMLEIMSVQEAKMSDIKGKKHSGKYGTEYQGDEDDEDDDKPKKAKQSEPSEKKGRGRPKKDSNADADKWKGADDAASKVIGGKAPKGKSNLPSKKHTLKDWIEHVQDTNQLNESDQVSIQPAQANTQVIKQGDKTLGTVTNPQLAQQIKQSIGKGEMSLAGNDLDESGLQAYLGNKKYGKEGMDALRKAGRDNASKQKMAKIRAKYNKMDEGEAEDLAYAKAKAQNDAMTRQQNTDAMIYTADKGQPPSPNEGPVMQQKKPMQRPPVVTREEANGDGCLRMQGDNMDLPMNEKAVSKAQQKFMGMVHAAQKGGKPASKEVAKVAKSMGKKDAKDFASTKHKGLPQHVKKESAAAPIGKDTVSAKERLAPHAGMGKGKIQQKVGQAGVVAKNIGRFLRGKSEIPTMEGYRLPDGTILTEGYMKDLVTRFIDDLATASSRGFNISTAVENGDLAAAKRAINNTLTHNERYKRLAHTLKTELRDYALEEFGFTDYDASLEECDTSPEIMAPAMAMDEKPTVFKASVKPEQEITPFSAGTPIDTSRPSSFLSGLRKSATTLESDTMKDMQFESWEKQLNKLMNEGLTISSSSGQQGSPDSVTISATDSDAQELLHIVRSAGLGVFGGGEQQSHDGMQSALMSVPGEEPNGHGTEPEVSPTVVGDGDDMLALIKKMTGFSTEQPAATHDYADEEGEEGEENEEDEEDYSSEQDEEDQEDSEGEESEEEDQDEEESDEEDVSEGWNDRLSNPDDYENYIERLRDLADDRKKEKREKSHTPQHDKSEKDDEPQNEAYGQADEGNAFTGHLKDTPQGKKFKMNGKTYKDTSSLEEDDMEEGNAFTEKLKKTPKGGEFKMGDKTYKDTSNIEESEDSCNECGMYESQCCCDHESVEEGFANDAGGDAMADTELMKLKALLSMGSDLHKMKRNQTTRDPVQVNVAEALSDWKKLSGIK